LTEIYLCHACSCHEIVRTETAGQVSVGAPIAGALAQWLGVGWTFAFLGSVGLCVNHLVLAEERLGFLEWCCCCCRRRYVLAPGAEEDGDIELQSIVPSSSSSSAEENIAKSMEVQAVNVAGVTKPRE
jgi:hypothetical protein